MTGRQLCYFRFRHLLPFGLPARQVMIGWLRVPFGHQLISVALADRAADFRFRIVDVAEEPRIGRARHHTGWLAFGFGFRLVVDAIDAQRALGHHLAALAELPRAVRTRPRAVLAADALVVIDEDDAVLLALVRRAGRADRHARRGVAIEGRRPGIERPR